MTLLRGGAWAAAGKDSSTETMNTHAKASPIFIFICFCRASTRPMPSVYGGSCCKCRWEEHLEGSAFLCVVSADLKPAIDLPGERLDDLQPLTPCCCRARARPSAQWRWSRPGLLAIRPSALRSSGKWLGVPNCQCPIRPGRYAWCLRPCTCCRRCPEPRRERPGREWLGRSTVEASPPKRGVVCRLPPIAIAVCTELHSRVRAAPDTRRPRQGWRFPGGIRRKWICRGVDGAWAGASRT
jgi:hypothetical protein